VFLASNRVHVKFREGVIVRLRLAVINILRGRPRWGERSRHRVVHNSSPSKPLRPDDYEDRISLCQRFLNVNSEVRSKRYVIDVYENGVLTEAAGDPIANATGKYIRVRATV
jgi:hypothetical protein